MNDVAEKETRLETCLQENNTKETLELLTDLAITFARQKNFSKAEHYRDRLYDIDPGALSEIIRVNGIIEEEKTEGINPNHRELFSELYKRLTTEQGNALFYAFEEITVHTDEYVFNQGSPCNSLFLVNQGELRAGCRQGNRNLLIKVITPGSFFGVDTFFSSSTSTTSVIASTTTTLYRISKDVFSQLKAKYPGLEAKLKDFCLHGGTISDHVQQKKLDRRDQQREKLFGNAVIQFLSNSGTLIGKPLRIGLHDVSIGGAAFMLRMSDEEKAGLMLGRKLIIQFSSSTVIPPVKVQKKATIVAISPSPFDDYSFHIKFEENLTIQNLQTILSVFTNRSVGA